jgi:PST family polysaccharide transporter
VRGGAELVALWAQLSSVIELVAAVALAGIGGGLIVLVAQAGDPRRQYALLREALHMGLAVSAPAMLILAALCLAAPRLIAGEEVPGALLAFGAAIGCASVVPGLVSNYWLGQQRRVPMLALAVVAAALPAVAAAIAPGDWLLASIVLASGLPALALAFVPRVPDTAQPPDEARQDRDALGRYLPAGISIGVLSPLSMLAARSLVGSHLSWESAGHLQALWRVSDWVAAPASGVLAVYFLPRLSAAWRTARFLPELRLAALAALAPSALALALLYAVHGEVFALLYDPGFRPSDAAAALFFGGTLVRIAAWVPLFGLYAARKTVAITLGEVLSLPLFAALLALFAEGLTLERAGVLWVLSFAVYAAFNLWTVRRS